MFELSFWEGIGFIILLVGATVTAGIMYALHLEYKKTNGVTYKSLILNATLVIVDLGIESVAFWLGVPQFIVSVVISLNMLALCVIGYFFERIRFSVSAALMVILSSVMFVAVSPQVSVVNPHDPRIRVVVSLGFAFVYVVHEHVWRSQDWIKKGRTMALCGGITAGFTATMLKATSESIAQAHSEKNLFYVSVLIMLYIFGVIVFGSNQGLLFNMALKLISPIEASALYTGTYMVCVSLGGILTFGEFVSMSRIDFTIYVFAMMCICVSTFMLSQSASSFHAYTEVPQSDSASPAPTPAPAPTPIPANHEHERERESELDSQKQKQKQKEKDVEMGIQNGHNRISA